jgi:polysaccharide biosynthesis protein PslG
MAVHVTRRWPIGFALALILVTAVLATDVRTRVASWLPLAEGVPEACKATAANGQVGFALGARPIQMRDADLNRELAEAKAAGARLIRFDVDWSQVEPERGQRDWTNPDRIVKAIVRHGMCPHAVVAYTPLWAADPGDRPTDTHFRPMEPRAFAEFAKDAALRYRGDVAIWEVWNEPNSKDFYKPRPDTSDYAALLRETYRAIKAVSPDLFVISGGLAPATDDGLAIAPLSFVGALYRAGANLYFDALGMHPYSYPALPDAANTGRWNAAQQLWPMHDIMVSGGDAATRIWLTEIGAPTGTSPVAVSDAVQAQTIQTVLMATRDVDWLGPVYVYTLRDSGTDLADPEQNFGVLRTDFTHKPAYGVIQQFVGAPT